MMPLQRACDAGSQVGNKSCQIDRRGCSQMWFHRVFCNVQAYVSCLGYAGILQSARVCSREYKVAPRIRGT